MATYVQSCCWYTCNHVHIFIFDNSGSVIMCYRCKFGQQGPGKVQFNSPHGFCLGVDEDIVIADTMNHRIQIFDKNGEYKNQFGIPGVTYA